MVHRLARCSLVGGVESAACELYAHIAIRSKSTEGFKALGFVSSGLHLTKCLRLVHAESISEMSEQARHPSNLPMPFQYELDTFNTRQ